MYVTHQPIIADLAQSGPAGLATVARFAIISPRVAFWRAVADCQSGNWRGHFTLKAEAFKDWQAHQVRHWHNLGNLVSKGRHVEALVYVAKRPGLALAKGGFVMQMAYGFAGCLDSINLDRFNLPASTCRSDAAKRGTEHIRLCRAARYLDRCAMLGGTEQLWDTWCEEVYFRSTQPGHVRPGHNNHNRNRWKSADHVSAAHCHAVGLDAPWRDVLDDIPF